MLRRLIIAMVLAAFIVVTAIASADNLVTGSPGENQYVAAESANTSLTTTSTGQNPSTVDSKASKVLEATCDNPVIKSSRKFTDEEKQAFVANVVKKAEEEKQKVNQKLTDEERAELETAARASAPAEEFSEAILSDDATSVGAPPNAKDDPNGTKLDAYAAKVKAGGCNSQPFRSSGGRLAAPAATAYYTPGWKSCTNSNWTTNSVGAVLAKVTQTSNWYSSSTGLPSNPWKSYSTSAGWGWSEKGAVQGGGPWVTVSYGVPIQYFAWTGQQFHFQHLKIELFTWYGEIDHWFGYSNAYGPRCSIVGWYP